MSYFVSLEDTDPCPVDGIHKTKPMQSVPDKYLIWLYAQPWLKAKYPEVYQYIVRCHKAIPDMILKKEDRK